MPDRRSAAVPLIVVLGIVALSLDGAVPLFVTLAALVVPLYRLSLALLATDPADAALPTPTTAATTASNILYKPSTASTTMADITVPATLIRAHVLPPPPREDGTTPSVDELLGFLLKRSDDPHPAAVVVYHVVPGSYADEHTGLAAGCEVLAVNKHRVRGDPQGVTNKIMYSLKKYGKVNLLCSLGHRRSGSSYLIGKMSVGGRGSAQSIPQDAFQGTDNVVDGLELRETRAGVVRVVSNAHLQGSLFAGLKLNKGDVLYAIDGHVITNIVSVRAALMEAAGQSHVMIPMLTYNSFRRLRVAVMAMGTRHVLGSGVDGSQGEARSIEDDYDIGQKLGEGAFAVVKKATQKATGCTYAIKIINRASLNKDVDAALQDEISILKDLDHEHIYKLDDVIVTINSYYLVTEYLDGGELFDRVVAKSKYTECEARDACRIMFSALDYMHSKGVAHRDLKPENLLLKSRDDDTQIKIADFGFAKETNGSLDADHSLSTMCGTPGYIAPEILRREKYGTKVDMFSMGVIVFILIGGYPPFYASTQRELLRMTRLGKWEFDREYWGHISDGVKDMISSLLVLKPNKRLSAGETLNHPWMVEGSTNDLSKSQAELKKYLARKRFRKAINSILFVNTFTGENAVFSGRCKRKAVKDLESEVEELGVEVQL